MTPRFTMRQALDDPQLLGGVLAGASWQTWRAMLIAAMGEELTGDEREVFTRFTGRAAEPLQRIEEAAFVVGRRGGKDRAAALLATYISGLCDHRDVLARGERGVVVCVAADQRQAAVTLGFIVAAFEQSPILAQLIANRTNDTLELTNGIVVEVRAASFRRLRGVTAIAVIASEIAFWHDVENSANPDVEIMGALRPALATTGGPVIQISSPYARRGVLWDTYDRHFGSKGDPLILVAQGASRDFNPTLPQSVVDRALERDPAANRAEYLAEFRVDCEQFVTIEAVRACVSTGVFEHAPSPRCDYRAWCDPSGGRGDAMTLAIAHRHDDRAILDLIREIKPPFSPEAVVREFAELLKLYRLDRVTGDQYAADWCREQFLKCGIRYKPAEKSKSDIFLDFLPALNSGLVDLLDHPRLIAQLVALERKPGRAKDLIDHPRDQHDDVANAVAGALTTVLNRKRWETGPPAVPGLPVIFVGDRMLGPGESSDGAQHLGRV